MAVKKVLVGDKVGTMPVHQDFTPEDELKDPLGGDIGGGGSSQITNIYNDAAAREAAIGFAASDVGTLVRQTDNNSVWMLVNHSPITWRQVDSPSPIQNLTYADANARNSAVGFGASDVGKMCLQEDNKTFWILTNHNPPTWIPMATPYTDLRSQSFSGYYAPSISSAGTIYRAKMGEPMILSFSNAGEIPGTVVHGTGASGIFNLYKGTTLIGTMTINGSNVDATFSVSDSPAENRHFAAGDIFSVAWASGSASDISMNFCFYTLSTSNPVLAASLIPDNVQTIEYTGSQHLVVVPDGISAFNVKMWGAGGGGQTAAGGGGGYVSATIPVLAGESLRIEVGGAGGPNSGCGGGFSGVYSNDRKRWLAIAGAGGGGGGAAYPGQPGGGETGTLIVDGSLSGRQPGLFTTGTHNLEATGKLYAGGEDESAISGGGYNGGGNSLDSLGYPGGGAGLYGGSGGNDSYGYPAGGGCSFIISDASNVVNARGSGQTPGGASDPDRGGAGNGGNAGSGLGTDGKVIVTWVPGIATALPAPYTLPVGGRTINVPQVFNTQVTNAAVVYSFVCPEPLALNASGGTFPGSYAKALSYLGTGTNDTEFTIKKNGAVTIGIITLTASNTNGVFSGCTTTAFTTDDYITIEAPNDVSGANVPKHLSLNMGFTSGASANPNIVIINPGLVELNSTYIFDTPNSFTKIVPAGCNKVTVKMWGAGGGGNSYYIAQTSAGGGGAYVAGDIYVSPGEELFFVVGQGGLGMNTTGAHGSTGGEASAIFRNNEPVAIAAGGGGGLSYSNIQLDGGAGGTTNGIDGEYSVAYHSIGGSQLRGGYYTGNSLITWGYFMTGGSTSTYGVTGGGGYFGGGGSYSGTNPSCAGGGSSWLPFGGNGIPGSGWQPGGYGDATLDPIRGTAGEGATGTNEEYQGKNGLIWIQFLAA